MALNVNTNVSSLNAQRNLSKSQSSLQTSLQRLSSGLRINSAKDDAAGLALSNRMTSQVRGLNQAVRNANDGISLAQTAEGALSESTNILQRMRELSVQSANGIYSAGDRSKLNAEFGQLNQELDRIAKTTSFNGQNILDGSMKSVALQIGSEAGQTITMKLQAVDTKSLGMGSVSVDMLGDNSDLASLTGSAALGENDVLINGQSIVKSGESYDSGNDNPEDLINFINKNIDGVTASTYAQTSATTVGDGVLTGTQTFKVDIAKLDGTASSIEVSDTKSLQELTDKLNEQGGGLINATIGDDGKLSISANDVATLTVTDTGAGTGGAGGTGITTAAEAKIVLTSDNGAPITVTRGSTGTLEQLNGLGFHENAAAGTVQGVGLTDATENWGVGDVTINGVAIAAEPGAANTGSLKGKIDHINAASSETGVTATAFASATLDFAGVDITGGLGSFALNGTDVDTATGVTDMETLAKAFNDVKDQTGVGARVLGSRIVLEGNVASMNFTDGGGDVATGLGGAILLSSYDEAAGGTTPTAVGAGDVVNGGIKLTSTNGNPISIQLGDNADEDVIGLQETNATAEGSFGTAIAQTSIDTAAHATKALGVIDKALDTINDIRAGLGAVSNRLDFTISNLSNIAENASAAQSRILDADFASETASMTKNQVLQQAGISILSQANSLPQQVLSLLR
jgi:flagellin